MATVAPALALALTLAAAMPLRAAITVTDDSGTVLRLERPAQRIVALSPHLVENLFAIGAGSQIVGAVDYSNYPEAAKSLPRVGSYARLDVEQVLAKKPDLVVGWQRGNIAAELERLKKLGLPVYLSQSNHFEDVATELRRLGQLTGREAQANSAASGFLERLARLRAASAGKPKVRVYYQIWQSPLMTIGGDQIISSTITSCGGENVFAAQKTMAPPITVEAVLKENAEAFVAGGMGEERRDWLEDWRKWPQLTAVSRNNLFFVPADLMQRHTLRLIDGAEQLCAHLDTARGRRGR